MGKLHTALCFLAAVAVYTVGAFNVQSVAKGLEQTLLKLGRKSGGVYPVRQKWVTVTGKKILTKVETTGEPEQVDLLFVLDRSGSIGNYKLGLARKFIKELTRYFSIAPSNTRVAMVTYSTSVQTAFDFRKHVNRECVHKELDKSMYSSGATATGPALQRAIQLYQSSSSGARPGVQRIVFVLTDGQSNRGINPATPAGVLKNSLGAKVFALGIGTNIRQSELQGIASQSNYVFQVGTFQDLQQVTNSFSQSTRFDSCSTSGTAYDECRRKCTCVNGILTNCCRVRKDFTSMTTPERQKFVRAMKTVSTTAPYKQRYDTLIGIHRQEFSNGIHLLNQFLPWHRYYLLELENLLREVDCSITVPYWDWSLWAHYPWNAANIWSTGNHGLGGNGSPGSRCVTNGPFASPAWSTTTGACLQREFNGVPPDAAQVQYCLSLTSFYDFEIFLRINLHNNFHCRVDGTMCTLDSANAPEFFLHHGFVDKIWGDWQKKSASNLHIHFPGVSQVHMRGSPYYAAELRDNNNLPGCVRVCYAEPTHGQSQKVLKFVKSLSRSQIKALRREDFTRVSQKSHNVFGVTISDRIRASQLETDSRRNVRKGVERGLKTTLERKTGFELVKPMPVLEIPEEKSIKILPFPRRKIQPRFAVNEDRDIILRRI